MKYADLHVHTNFSDGTFTPEEVVTTAKGKGLSCISITDHDSVLGILPAEQASADDDMEIIPGVELSSEFQDREVHILGYLIDWRAEWFKEKLQQLCMVRQERAVAILTKLRSQGIKLDEEELLQNARPGSVGRMHIARMMKEEGFVFSLQEAFDKYIGNDRPCYVKKFKLTPAQAIGMIDRLKGVAVLAHPHCIGDDQLIPEFVDMGLRGIEVYYPDLGQKVIEHYLDLARQYGLLVTGGSDCHGLGKSRILLGEVKIPYSLVDALKQAAGW